MRMILHTKHKLLVFTILLFTLLFGAPSPAFAHQFKYAAIKTTIAIDGYVIHMHMEEPEVLQAPSEDQLRDYITKHIYILENKNLCPFTLQNLSTKNNTVAFDADFICRHKVDSIDTLTIHTNAFADFFETYDNYTVLTLGDKTWELVFTKEKTMFPGQVEAVEVGTFLSKIKIAIHFIWFGILHILTGYDHILFLFSIILLIRSLRKVVILVTSFTVAHSITLILASFHVISVHSSIVEPLIALSIIYMAFLNVRTLRTAKMKYNSSTTHIEERWLITFLFGLIHGLGFASALTEAQIPQTFFVPSLIFFNVGIELGQLSILLLLYPILKRIDVLKYRKMILIVISGGIIVLGFFWLIQRIFFQ